ncbi:hypothetical protein V7S43_011089 [Phytophthora oleae]|uniref:Myosin motor domain-containing protein n=1 Tax=Phytophthora oleae TaxID=2107226 RepID=A0ABD3FBK7_9STRA
MKSAIGSITHLPSRFKSSKKQDVKHAEDTLQAVRSKRVAAFFRVKARQRSGVTTLASLVGRSAAAVSALLRSLRHAAVGYFSRKRGKLTAFGQSKWGRKLRSALTGEKSLLSMFQKTLGRTFGRSAEKLEQERRQHQVRIYQWVCRALARLGRSAIAAAHRRRRAEGVAHVSREIVSRLLNETVLKVATTRIQERLDTQARVVQRLWRLLKRNEKAALESKDRLLNLLTDLPARLRELQQSQQQGLKNVHDASTSSTALFIRRAARRLAARMIQRVWRGHYARERVRRIRDWKLKKFQRQRQRERLREARGALLAPSEVERARRKELETRLLARQQETPVLPLPRREGRYQRRGERATLLEPLPLQRPPHLSAFTRTKVQCVPFSRFEKIVVRDARVNLNNVWVAIPVGHQEVPEEAGDRHGELRPLLVGRGREKKKGGLKTTYDWVPAHLLQSKEEREATASRQRQRAASPVSKKILQF